MTLGPSTRDAGAQCKRNKAQQQRTQTFATTKLAATTDGPWACISQNESTYAEKGKVSNSTGLLLKILHLRIEGDSRLLLLAGWLVIEAVPLFPLQAKGEYNRTIELYSDIMLGNI